jgi:hypothetical protein
MILFVEKVFSADLVESGEIVGPARDDFLGRDARLQLLHCVGMADELD